MRYYQFEFTFVDLSSGEFPEYIKDQMTYELSEIGFEGFWEQESSLFAYIPTEQYDHASLLELLEGDTIGKYVQDYSYEEMKDKNWNEEWEKNYFKPLRIGDLLIRASFHEAVLGDASMEIIIDPKMAFGTGNHATTAGMISLIGKYVKPGVSLIDMGCGSGILGIYAMKLGAQSCTSIDFDHWSVENTLQNATLNGVSLSVLHGDASCLVGQEGSVDLFLANINRNVILADLSYYTSCLKEDGRLLLSGFYESDLEMISEALRGEGYVIEDQCVQSSWVALSARKG